MRYPHPETGAPPPATSSPWLQKLMKGLWRPTPTMPGPLLTFEGGAAAQFCACAPPDSDGDVGPNHYVEAINNAFAIYDKSGSTLAGPITYNTLFAALTGTPCSGSNHGDPFVLYDHMANRWVITDFAFPGGLPGSGPFFECIAVSQTADPVAGGWFLYALQHEPAHPTWIGDYPKFALWNNPQPGGAYHFTVNLFDGPTLAFQGVRTFALDRASMLTGSPATAIAFSVPLAGVGDSYSFVPATFRTGTAPPAGRDEMVLAIDSPASGGVALTQVHARFFHVDFVTPANSTLGVGSNHTPNAEITVNAFVDAFTNSGTLIVPQQGTTQMLDTLGDKIMTPMVYQNRGGTESLWTSNTVCTDAPCTQPTGVRWYQFNVTGGTFPATPVQQQTWTNGNDGLYRFMSSVAVDNAGNTAMGYATSSSTAFPGIRYAGRLVSDPPSNLGQGEATLFSGAGSQTGTNGRWGDYSMTTIDPTDNMTFWTVGEYYANTNSFDWHTRIGKFQFPAGPTPTPTATATFTPTPTATFTPTATATFTPTATPTATATSTPTPTPTPTVIPGIVRVTATAGNTGPVDYPSVKAAFDAINAGTHQGAIDVAILSDTTEVAPAVLNASGAPSSYTSVLVHPSGGIARTVSGAIVAGSPLIDLNGADNVTINGLNTAAIP